MTIDLSVASRQVRAASKGVAWYLIGGIPSAALCRAAATNGWIPWVTDSHTGCDQTSWGWIMRNKFGVFRLISGYFGLFQDNRIKMSHGAVWIATARKSSVSLGIARSEKGRKFAIARIRSIWQLGPYSTQSRPSTWQPSSAEAQRKPVKTECSQLRRPKMPVKTPSDASRTGGGCLRTAKV